MSVKILAALLAVLAAPAIAENADASAFGCSQHEFGVVMPTVEGENGVFYRSFPDLRLQYAMEDPVIAQLVRLQAALKAQGTTLVYVTIPTKSSVMPGALPAKAADYGYDSAVGAEVYRDFVARLQAAGIVAPEIMSALHSAPEGGETPMYGVDFHWSSVGARLAAQAIGAAIKADPSYGDVTPKTFVSTESGIAYPFSSMRVGLQTYCLDALPVVQTMSYATVQAAGADGALDIGLGAPAADSATADEGLVDIFGTGGGDGSAGPDVVLVGTSFSDSEANNFAGFLSEFTALEVTNYAISGGNQFGAITSYLTSREFREARPKFLIWENPIYNNLAVFGPAPMEELIALAGPDCAQPLDQVSLEGTSISATFGSAPARGDVIYIDLGSEGARSADISLTTSDGLVRTTRMQRGDRLRATGTFMLWLEPYWLPGLTKIEVTADRPLGAAAGLSLCSTLKGETP